MRKAGRIRLGVATLGGTVLILAPTLGIIYGTKGGKQSHGVLRLVKNSVKTKSWYKADASASYGPNTILEDGLISPKLFRDTTVGVDEYNRDKPNAKNPWSKTNNIMHISTFDLVDYILLKDKDGKYIGTDTSGQVTERTTQGLYGTLSDAEKKKYQWNDEIKSLDTTKNTVTPGDRSLVALKYPIPNKETTFEKASKLAKGGFDLHVRENIPWVDSTGNIKKNPKTNKPYTLKIRDFYYSMIRTLMGGSKTRLMPKTAQNPFGGFEDKRGYPLSKNEKKNNAPKPDENIVNFQAKWDANANSTNTNISRVNNYPNNYLFGLYNYRGLIQMVTPMSGGKKAPLEIDANSTKVTNWKTSGLVKNEKQNLLSFDTLGSTPTEKDNVSFADTKSNLKGLLYKVLAQTKDLSPAPSDYIENEVTNRKVTLNNGNTLSVPNGLVKALGVATYAIKASDALSVAPMYFAESTTNRSKFKKNTHYWNKKWVNSPHSINTYIVDYVLQPDKALFGQSQLSAFKSGRIANLSLDNQSKNKRLELQRSSAAKFSMGSQSTSSIGSLVPNLIPFSKEGKGYNFNNAYSKLVYGVPISELNKGNAKTIQNFASPKSIAFRSLIGAAINWFTLAKELKPDNSSISWNTAVPPNMKINPDGSQKSEEFIDQLERINSVHAYVPKGSSLSELQDGGKSAGDWSNSKTWFINHSSNVKISMQSKTFAEIKKKMKVLLDTEVPGEQVVFELRNYWANYIDSKNGFDSAAEVLNHIYPKKLRVGALDDPSSRGYIFRKYPTAADRNRFFNRSSFVRGQGWGADYQGFGTMLTYFDIFGSIPLSMSIKKHGKTLPEYNKLFKEVVAYATIFEHEYKTLYNNSINTDPDLVAALRPTLSDMTDLKNGTPKGERMFQAIQKPGWESIVTDTDKQKKVKKFISNKIVSFESIVDRKIQVNGLSKSKDGTLPQDVREAYKTLSTNTGIVNLFRQLRDITGMVPDSRATVSDPTSPVASLVQTYLQMSYSPNPEVVLPLNIIVDVPREKRKNFKEWI